MKVSIISIDASVLKSSAGGIVVIFSHEGIEHSVNVYPGQNLKERIRQKINDHYNTELKQLEAEILVEELKKLEGTELDIGEI